MIIEEIGEVDEDEEDYGIYQKDRASSVEAANEVFVYGNDEVKMDWFWSDGRYNEYALEREAPTLKKK